jgi:hypothetical protein
MKLVPQAYSVGKTKILTVKTQVDILNNMGEKG